MNSTKKDLITLFAVVLAIMIFLTVDFLLTIIDSAPRPTETPTTTDKNSLPETTPSTPIEPSEITITAKANKPTSGLGVTIAPIEVVEDSRCPVDENIRCIQAGTVRVRTKVTNVNGERILVFAIGIPVVSKTETIELTEVLPSARAEVPIVTNEYRFVFKIAKKSGGY